MFEFLDNQNLIAFAKNHLPPTGELCQNADRYVFLKIPDDYILKLFPFVLEPEKEIPDYFLPPKTSGAHISVIYPGELDVIPSLPEVGSMFAFEVHRYFTATLGNKSYYGCTVKSPLLLELRAKVGLSATLTFRTYRVPLHFTVAVKNLNLVSDDEQ